MERYMREMGVGACAGKVSEAFKAALYGGHVNGTPTIYLSGVCLNNIRSLESLLAAVIGAGATLRSDFGERTNRLSRLRNFRPVMTRLHL